MAKHIVQINEDQLDLTNTEASIAAEAATRDAADVALNNRAADIEEKIPTQASSENQLADKAFVNSTVATNTAYYISNNGEPFDSLAQLQAYSGTVTNNDYAFVKTKDSDGNTVYERYKYNALTSTWAHEYDLNNSSFTAAQWAAIESGITAEKVAQIDANTAELDNKLDIATAASTYATKTDLTTKASNADGRTIVESGTAITTVAVREQNANAVVKEWVGIKAQYDALANKDANTLYTITDEDDSAFLAVDSSLSSVSTNPVQNKVIKAALDGKQNSGDYATSAALTSGLATKQDTLPNGTTGYFLQKTASSVQWAEVADHDLSNYLQNTATDASSSLTIAGTATTLADSVNVGPSSEAYPSYALAVGWDARAKTGSTALVGPTAVGAQARAAGANSVAVGRGSRANATNSIAIGGGASNAVASVADSAIQLGAGANSTANTFQVFNTTVVDANGKIPAANLDTAIPSVPTDVSAFNNDAGYITSSSLPTWTYNSDTENLTIS